MFANSSRFVPPMPLKQFPTLSISVRAFGFHPLMAKAGAVGFESQPGNGFQKRLPILEALRIADVDAIGATQHIGQLRLALRDRQSTQVAFPEP